MLTFAKYLQYRAPWLLLPLLWAALLGAVFWLYELPQACLLYALAICLAPSLAWLGVDYLRFYQRHREMRGLTAALQADWQQLPAPRNLPEADWTLLFNSVCRHKQQQLEEAQEQNRQMADYFTTWGHQIKTPLAALRLQIQGQPLEQVQQIEQYVEMLLTYLHLQAQASDYVIRQYDLDEIIQQAVRHFAPQFIRRSLRLQYQPFGVKVLTDARWLLFVLEQVLSNALKYTPDRPESLISITLEPPLTLCLKDNGIGIAPEDLARIFEQGYTGANGRAFGANPNQPASASGLGLYLCQRVCANLGHRIWADSTPGQGTTIKIALHSQPRGWE